MRPAAKPRTTAGDRPSRHKPRVRNPGRTRALLIDAAERVFNRQGYFATHSNAIAAAAGLAPASFYTHFDDKLAIFLEVYDRWVQGEWRAIEAAGAQVSRGDGALALAVTAALTRRHRAWRGFRASLRALAAIEPAVRARQNAGRRQQITWLERTAVARGWRRPSRAQCAVTLLALERVLDAAADGDARTLGCAAADIERCAADLLLHLVRGADQKKSSAKPSA
jgi:AcrR family transcriptional regulator